MEQDNKLYALYHTNVLILRDMVNTKILSPQLANTVSEEFAKQFHQKPIYLW